MGDGDSNAKKDREIGREGGLLGKQDIMCSGDHVM